MAKKETTKKNSTLAISPDISEKLDFFCKKNNITKKDFISLSLSYFERTGVDLKSNDISNNISFLNDKLDSILKLQADTAIKLTGIQQTTNILSEVKEDTTKLIESKSKKKGFFSVFKKSE